MEKQKAKKKSQEKIEKLEKKQKFGVVNYPVGDFLIQIKNAALAKKRDVDNRENKFVNEIAKVLKKEGFLDKVTLEKGVLKVTLAFRKKTPVLMDLKLVSRPGLRIYWGVDELEKQRGPSIFILSTPEGILSSKEAIKKRAGGEVICEIW